MVPECRAAADHGETGAAGNLLGDEDVHRARVDEGMDVDAAQLEAHLHSVVGVDASDRVEQHLRCRIGGVNRGGVSVIICRCQVQQQQALAHLVVTTPELFVAIEAKAEPAAFFHLGHRQGPDGAALHRDGGGCGSCGRWRSRARHGGGTGRRPCCWSLGGAGGGTTAAYCSRSSSLRARLMATMSDLELWSSTLRLRGG